MKADSSGASYSARVANSGNAIIGSRSRCTSLSVTLILLLDVCATCLRGLRRGLRHLSAWLFFLTKPWWQVIQGGLSGTDRSLELRKIFSFERLTERQ